MTFAALALLGCPEEESTAPPVTPPPTATTAATPPTASQVALQPQTDASSAPGVTARAKLELDGKDPKGDPGTTLAVTGSKGTFTTPAKWKNEKKGAWDNSIAADGKAHFTAGSFKAGEDSAAKVKGGEGALGYTDCTWSGNESIAIGKDRLAATVADGICKKDGASVKTVTATISGDELNIVAVGGWAEGGGDAALFEIFRTVKKAGGGGDPTGIAACCAALKQNSVSAPPEQKGAYLAAFGACNAIRSNPQGRAALSQVRALLGGANVPAPCR